MGSSAPQSWNDFSAQTVVLLVALIATPALLMAIMLTRNPRKTLLLKAPHPIAAPAAVALALLLHPSAVCLAQTVQLPPALCEEFAFRGFILSGLRHMGHKWAAIVLSSVFFGATHGILQQSLAACIVGVVLGFLAVQTGSLLPSICFHLTYNAASIWMGVALPKKFEQSPVLSWLFEPSGEGYIYRWPVVIGGAALAVALLYWFRRLPHQSSAEESLQEALDHQKSPALGKPSGI
jgi:sodium transport system permease protein